MKIIISEDALDWFQKEMEVEPGDAVHFFVRYGGASKLQPGFSLGVTKDQPLDPVAEFNHQDVNYFVETNDLWYFDGHDLHVQVNDKLKELEYSYEKA